MIDYKGFEARRTAASRGISGIGLSSYIEACGIAPSAVAGALGARVGLYESATVRVDPTGTVNVFTGTHSHGQGHDTTFAQIVADKLGVDIGSVQIIHGDSDKIPFGMGSYGSRSLAVGGAAIAKAVDKVIDKAKIIAAHLMEAADADVVFADGKFTVAGTDSEKGFGDIALAAYVPHNYPHDRLEPGLEETAFYDPLNFTYPSGTHIAEVEIDPATGVVELVDWACCDDFGNLINPMIVEGQVQAVSPRAWPALLENALRRDRTVDHGVLHGLLHAARRRPAELQGRLHRHRMPPTTSGSRAAVKLGHRVAAGADQRRHRRAVAARRHRHVDAGIAGKGMARDQRRPGQPGIRENTMHHTTYVKASADDAVAKWPMEPSLAGGRRFFQQ